MNKQRRQYINKETIPPKVTIKAILNSIYFHSDTEQESIANRLLNADSGIIKGFFVLYIINLIRVIVELNKIVKEVLK